MVGATVLAVLCIGIGSLLAMAHAAFDRTNPVRAEAIQDDAKRERVLRILRDHPRHVNSLFLSSVLLQNASAILVAFVADRSFGVWGITVAGFFFALTWYVVVLAVARAFGLLQSHRLVVVLAWVVSLNTRLMWPLSAFLIGLANVILPGKGIKQGPFVSEQDIRSLADTSTASGGIGVEERELIHSIFELGATPAREIMTPRPDMATVESRTLATDAIKVCLERGFSRLPVYDLDPEKVTGIVVLKDLVRAQPLSQVRELIRPTVFVPETIPVDELLKLLRTRRHHMGIVVDEFGAVEGLVTLEDVIEEIVGEITDESDTQGLTIASMDDGSFRVAARTTISEFNEGVGADLVENDEWTTVGGLMLGILGRLPNQGERIAHEGFVFHAEAIEGRRLSSVIVRRDE